MGLAPSENRENLGKSAARKVPVPIFSQPPSVESSLTKFVYLDFTVFSIVAEISGLLKRHKRPWMH
jgi:hypothetical protein